MGAWISDTTPEKIADRLREVMRDQPDEPPTPPATTPAPGTPQPGTAQPGPAVPGAAVPGAAQPDAADLITAWPEPEGAARARGLFAQTFDAAPDGVWSAPGRVNLVGEHTDYNDGLCLPIALPHRTFVALRTRADAPPGRPVRLVSAQEPGTPDPTTGQPAVRSQDLDAVGPAGGSGAVPGWPAYAVGVAWALEQAGLARDLPGFDVAVDSCVPYGAGLSSSAALECAVAVALDDAADLGLAGPAATPDDMGRARLAAACVRAENEVAGAPTGGMDQAAALRARDGHALLLDCRDGSVEHVPFDLAPAGLALLVIDTRAEHQLVDGQYASRRAACREAARRLGVDSLRVVADAVTAGGSLDDVLARLDDDEQRRRVRHVVTEIARVRELAALLRAHPGAALREVLDQVGAILDTSHVSARDDYEISSPELDLAVTASRAAGAHGARMTGGGFGGSAVALVEAAHAKDIADAVARAFAGAGFHAPAFLLASAAGPAGRVADA
ncbi:galactokinase [Georgenia sp. SYP-B2076]|uniref:galactokinase n=1 Tax=Georgenia sp. SYP-B2076 TaxID=2495881 RepID=UPI001F0BE229|nr:galactokinase [Georgenia sp. SYP-B2076]